MSNKQFISKLSATYADVHKLDVKKINLKGKNILDYIKESTPTIKHSQDTRETVTENDLWGQWVETKADGTIIIHDDWVTNPNASSSSAWNSSITKVEDNKGYVGDTLYGNIQTEKIKDGNDMFANCSNLTSFSADLSSLIYGYDMFKGCENLNSFSADLSSLTIGYEMFGDCKNLTSFNSDLSSLTNGKNMFYRSGINSFNSDLPSLTNGLYMFYNCTNLTSFNFDLSSLTNGLYMFYNCTNLTSFNFDLSSLTNGYYMFANCSNLTSFSSDLRSLTDGYEMFGDCKNLTSFNSDLSSLTNGGIMFANCSNLTSFTSDLSSLIYGYDMFYMCKLDAESVMYIADTIKDIPAEKQLYIDGTIPYVTEDRSVGWPYKYSAPRGFMSDGAYVYTYDSETQPITDKIVYTNVGKLSLGINVSNNTDTIQQQLEDFAKEATFDSWADLKQLFVDKGWTVTFQYGGTSTSITYGLREGEQIIPCPIFAKLVQVENKDSAEYCTEDASTFYNIEWGHDVTDTSSYTQFDSLEDAMTSWNIFPKENIISTEE